ncbi:unnamed protein product, partial [Medioppia subpectinata]
MLSKLKDFDQDFGDEWTTLANITETDDPNIKIRQQSLIDEYIRKMMDSLPVSKFMTYGVSADDFLIPSFFRCASDRFHPSEPCILNSQVRACDKTALLVRCHVQPIAVPIAPFEQIFLRVLQTAPHERQLRLPTLAPGNTRKYANVITTTQDLGNCFTLFHRGRSELLTSIAIESGLSQSPVRRGADNEAVNIEISEEPFHPNEIIRLKLDFKAGEYTTLNEPVMGHVIVHDDHEAPPIREKNFNLFPGNYYEFYISKESDKLLPKPYATDCVDHKLSSYDGSEDVNEYLHHPLSKGNCIIGCMAQATMDRCQCWPPELPFMRGSLEDAQENLLKWCDWDGDGLDVAPNQPDKPANATWFQYCFTVHETQCKAKCNSDCKIDRYRIIKEVRQWPSTERIEHSKKGDYLYDMRQCCAIVSIRYWSAEQVINQYQPKFETAEFSSYIGGLLSMWVGFSLLGLYDVIEGIVVYMYKRVKENAQDNNKLGGLTGLNKLSPIIEPIQVFNTSNNATKYPDPYGNHQLYRQRWRRAARVATIVDRWTHSGNQTNK